MFFYLLFAVGLALPGKKAGPLAVICCLAFLVAAGLLVASAKRLWQILYQQHRAGFHTGSDDRADPHRYTFASNRIEQGAGGVFGRCRHYSCPCAAADISYVSRFPVEGLPACLIVGGALILERWG